MRLKALSPPYKTLWLNRREKDPFGRPKKP
jgi:hypothetical protein